MKTSLYGFFSKVSRPVVLNPIVRKILLHVMIKVQKPFLSHTTVKLAALMCRKFDVKLKCIPVSANIFRRHIENIAEDGRNKHQDKLCSVGGLLYSWMEAQIFLTCLSLRQLLGAISIIKLSFLSHQRKDIPKKKDFPKKDGPKKTNSARQFL